MIGGSPALTGLTIGLTVSLLAIGLGLLIGYLYWETLEQQKEADAALRKARQRLDNMYRHY